MLYDVNGNLVNTVYNSNGQQIYQAYDVDGNAVIMSGTTLRVMSYNVGQWYIGTNTNVPTDKYSEYYAMQREIVSKYNLDVMAVQEYYDPFSSGHSTESVIGEFFTDQKHNTNSTYRAKATYTNGYEQSNYSEVYFADGNRSYIKSSIEVDGKTIWLLNAHLETSGQEATKVAESTELLEAVSNLEYFIIMGDFNTVCRSVSDPEYTTIMKQFIDAGYHSANCSAQHGFIDTWTSGTTASGTWYPCDQIITSANIAITSVIADQTKVTDDLGDVIDHIPIVATLIVL